MGSDTLIDDRVSTSQIEKAVEALHAFESKKQAQREETDLLLGKEPNIWLNITVKQVAPKNKIKPYKIPIVHPLVDPRTTSVCLITKDPQREYKDLLETHNIKFISRVVGIAKLKGKFKAFEARRLLLKENGLFLADDRVIPLLPKLLGSKWFEAKKQPIPVNLTRKDLKGELERAISSTYMHQNNGTCTSIKVANLSHKPQQIVSNISKAIPAIASHTPGGWDNIQSLLIKTNTSVSLPIWNCDLEGRWSGSIKNGGEKKEKDQKVGGNVKGKKKEQISKKRPAENEEDEQSEEEEQPKKKIKSAKEPAVTTLLPTKSVSKSKQSQVQAQPTSASSTDHKPKKPAKSATPLSSEAQLKQKPTENVRSDSDSTQPKVKANPQSASPLENNELTKNDLKQKRIGAALIQKKKQKVVGAKAGASGKSAKAKILGRKALQA